MAYDKLVDSAKLDGALKDTADAIRSKTKESGNIQWNETTGFKAAVEGIVVGDSINAQSKRVTPKKEEQTVTPDSGYNALSSVTVEKIPDNYIEPSGTLEIANNGTHNVTDYAAVDVSVPAVGVELPNLENPGSDSDLLQDKELIDSSGKVVKGTMPDNGTVTQILDTKHTSYVIPKGKHSGQGEVSINKEVKNATPTTSQQTISPSDGRVLSAVNIEAIQVQSKQIYRNGTYAPDDGKFFNLVTVNVLTDAKLDEAAEYTFGQIGITQTSATVSFTCAETIRVEDEKIVLDNPSTISVTMQSSDTDGSRFNQLRGLYFQKSGATYYVPPECVITKRNVTGGAGATTGYKFVGSIYPVIFDTGVVLGTKTITENGTYRAADEGFDGFESVSVNVPASGIDTSDATAGPENILDGLTAYVDGVKITGTMPNHFAVGCTLDGVNFLRHEFLEGHYDSVTAIFDSTPIEALLDAI